MINQDTVLAVLAIACMIIFNMILLVFVKDIALSIVLILGLALMIYDFWRQFSARRQKG